MVASTPYGSSLDVYDWLSRFVNLERGQTVKSLTLDRAKVLAELSGRPETCAPSIHVAGSKGKGSVTGMAAAILEARGIKTARYASPHVSDFRERLAWGGKFFDEEIYIRSGEEMRELVSRLPSSGSAALFDPEKGGEAPTFFELMTLWFFLAARLAGAGALAVETGMGGRLDATNIIPSLVSVITLIELEHTEYLGSSLAAVAAEKAGIIKPGRPLVLAEQNDEALAVFRERARLCKSPLLYFPDCVSLLDIRARREGTFFDLCLANGKDAGAKKETFEGLFIPIPGKVYAMNAALAALTVKTAFPDTDEEAIRKGLAGFTLPARFERISETPPVIVDGAHTGQSVKACLETFCSLYGKGGVLVFGCAAGKDLLSMAELCVPLFSTIIVTTPGAFKKSFPEDIYAAFLAEAEKLNKPAASAASSSLPPQILLIKDTREAAEKAVSLALERGLPVLGAGSFYLAGELRKHILPG